MKKKLKVVCIADLQAQGPQIKPSLLPEGDILIIAGDLGGWGTIKELQDCNTWLKTLNYKHKLVVAGNHDKEMPNIDGHKLFTNCTYLQDEFIEIEGLKIYGSPANEMNELRMFGNWAFCEPAYLRKVAEDIPEKLDILITHGPPLSILDELWWNHKSVGSWDLLNAVTEKKPKYHVFGHIHEGHGTKKIGKTTYVNAAICDPENRMFKSNKNATLWYQPIVIEL